MTVLNYVLIGLVAWTAVSIVAGLGIGAVLKHCGAADDYMLAAGPVPLRKSA